MTDQTTTDDEQTDEQETYYALLSFKVDSERDATYIANSLSAMLEDSGQWRDHMTPPENASGQGLSEKPITRDRIRSLVRFLNSRGSRPTPNGFLRRLGIEPTADEEDE